MDEPLVAVVGPTASGKSAWALAIAEAFGGEVVGADSRQVYAGMTIGTVQPSDAARARVRHHLIGHADPADRYNLVRFLAEARAAIEEIRSRGRLPVLVGGSGQYVWALLEGWSVPEVEPDLELRARLEGRASSEGAATLHADLESVDGRAAERIAATNVRRVIRALEVHAVTGRPISDWHEARDPMKALVVAPEVGLEQLDARIGARAKGMFEAGFVEEVRALLAGGVAPEVAAMESVGYREVCRHLAGELSEEETVEVVTQSTRQLARRQLRWFRPNDARIQWVAQVQQALALAAVALRDARNG